MYKNVPKQHVSPDGQTDNGEAIPMSEPAYTQYRNIEVWSFCVKQKHRGMVILVKV